MGEENGVSLPVAVDAHIRFLRGLVGNERLDNEVAKFAHCLAHLHKKKKKIHCTQTEGVGGNTNNVRTRILKHVHCQYVLK